MSDGSSIFSVSPALVEAASDFVDHVKGVDPTIRVTIVFSTGTKANILTNEHTKNAVARTLQSIATSTVSMGPVGDAENQS